MHYSYPNTDMKGFLELIFGPMFSGKTTEIVSIYKRYKCYNASVCVVNHTLDKRYSESMLTTHDGVSVETSLQIEKSRDLLREEYLDNYEIFLINEGQFFDDLFHTVIQLVDVHKKKVHICGLDGDYNREPFGDILRLIPYADSVKKKTAFCKKCMDGTPAIFTKRLVKSESKILIGETNFYIPVCRECFSKNEGNELCY